MVISLTVIAFDQWSKYVVLRELTTALDGSAAPVKRFISDAPPQGFDGLHYQHKRSITVSESFLRLRYAENPGAAFGLFRSVPDNLRGPLFHLVSIGAVVLIAYYFRKLKGLPEERWALYGLPLVLGGAIGNYLDRLSRGFVIDFLEAHWFDNPQLVWPSFNVADSAICIGVGMLVIDSFVRKEAKAPEAVKA